MMWLMDRQLLRKFLRAISLIIIFIAGTWLTCVPPDWYIAHVLVQPQPHLIRKLLFLALGAFLLAALVALLYDKNKAWLRVAVAGSLFPILYYPVYALLGGTTIGLWFFVAVPLLFGLGSYTGEKLWVHLKQSVPPKISDNKT